MSVWEPSFKGTKLPRCRKTFWLRRCEPHHQFDVMIFCCCGRELYNIKNWRQLNQVVYEDAR